jgi:hypothetical protein
LLDELVIHQIPVLFGRRQFEVLPSRVELEIVRVTRQQPHTCATASVAEPVDGVGQMARGALGTR